MQLINKISPVGIQSQAAHITARAAVLQAPGKILLRQIVVPPPDPNQVRVRLEGCGVCASNIPVWQGQEWMEYPLEPGAPGHEAWGRIESVGSIVRGFSIGDRVAMLSSHSYAEYDLANAHDLVKLPSCLDGLPVPGEALGCAINIFRRSQIQNRHAVAIVGIGFLGALLTQLATNAGAHVIAISRRRFALDLARQFGAKETLQWNDSAAVTNRILDLTNGHGCERVIEAVGKQSSLDLATNLTAERGKLVIAGYHQDGPRQINMQLWNWRGLDVINAHERDSEVYVQGIVEAISAIQAGTMDPVPLYTDQFALDELSKAFSAVAERPDGFLKALISL